MRSSKFRNYSNEQIIEMYFNLCQKGKLTAAEKELLKKLEKELKARGLKNVKKR